ncbi:MAG: DUF4430 domain-containing protein [Oscillospiraceae bacterium]|nr:DUF4430 domain-containing protein [Oscillospiraceae bacterium]
MNKKILITAASSLLCFILAGCSVETAGAHDEKLRQSETSVTTQITSVQKTSVSSEILTSDTRPASGSVTQKSQLSDDSAAAPEQQENVKQGGASDSADSHISEEIQTDNSLSDEQAALPATDGEAMTETQQENKISVSISIRCDSALDNWDKLADSAKNSDTVPQSGIILDSVSVNVKQGSTVFSVIRQACNENNIKFDYSGNESRKTVYITGINGLYEKDCGSMSGWVYTVNGEKVMTGASGYILNDSDIVEFIYTV